MPKGAFHGNGILVDDAEENPTNEQCSSGVQAVTCSFAPFSPCPLRSALAPPPPPPPPCANVLRMRAASEPTLVCVYVCAART